MTEGWDVFAALALSLVLGAAFGALYLGLLWRASRGLIKARGGAGRLVLGYALRLGLLLAGLVLAVRSGAGASHLLAAVVGFTIMRQVILRHRLRKE